MARPLLRFAFALSLCALPVALSLLPLACGQTSAAATKPMSPAEGAGDYKENPAGPHDRPIVPSVGTEPSASAPPPKGSAASECPPTCGADGGWIGCGLKKPRGTKCQGCTPKCKAKGTSDAGWYDCEGVLIVLSQCG